MRVAIEVADWVAVCFNAAVTETYRIPDKRRHPGMGRLGPDLCESNTDPSVAVNLLLSHKDGAARLGEVLLDQRVVRGLGNLYRSEVLWATELSPFARIDSLTERDAIRLVNAAAAMLRANMQQRRTRSQRRRRRADSPCTAVMVSVAGGVAKRSIVGRLASTAGCSIGAAAVNSTMIRIRKCRPMTRPWTRIPRRRRTSPACHGIATPADSSPEDWRSRSAAAEDPVDVDLDDGAVVAVLGLLIPGGVPVDAGLDACRVS